MNYLIQRGKVRSQVINVPEGLPEILSDITREVLRCQPTAECLCQFIIDYLHSIIVAREKARVAKSIIDRALRIVDEIISDMCICDISKEKAELMSEAMEDCFKHFLAKKRCELGRESEIIKFGDIDLLDEMIEKCHFSEQELKISRPVIEAAYEKFIETYMASQENVDSTEALYQYFREREMERILLRKKSRAATLIQATFRGYMVRRSLAAQRATTQEGLPRPSEDYEQRMVQDLAARKIQQFFRNRLSSRKFRAESAVAAKPDGVCDEESQISLTVRKVDYLQSKQQSKEEVEKAEEMDTEVPPTTEGASPTTEGASPTIEGASPTIEGAPPTIEGATSKQQVPEAPVETPPVEEPPATQIEPVETEAPIPAPPPSTERIEEKQPEADTAEAPAPVAEEAPPAAEEASPGE